MATTAGYRSTSFATSPTTSFASSPLASSSSRKPVSRPQPLRTPSFPPSRPLRPFASIAHSIAPPNGSSKSTAKKQVKLIEPPKNYTGTFVLNLTQAELGRQA